MRIIFTDRGGVDHAVAARVGQRLLDVAQAAGQPLEGTCDGDMACATCHVIVHADDVARLPAASADEEDMLDLALGATRTSRLACQIVIGPLLDGLRVRIPPG